MFNGDPFDFLGEPARPQPSAPSVSMPDVAVIKSYLEEVSPHAGRAATAAGLDLSTVKLVASSFPDARERGLSSAFSHALLNDKKGGPKLIGKATAWAAEPGRNVYLGLQLMRREVHASGRGGHDDVVAVVGLSADLDGDKGRAWDPASFPIPPTLTVITSRVPALNRQPQWWLTKAIDAARAKRLAAALCKLVSDEDGATRDIARVWRIPGSLNWPNRAKVGRGRPAEPQLVEWDGTIGKAADPDAFEAALAEALGLPNLDSFGEPKATAKAPPAASESPQEAASEPPQAEAPKRVYSAQDRDRWDGTRNELLRVATALTFVDADPRETWLKVGNALWYYAPNDPWSRMLWDTWSGGGNFEGLPYGGSPKFNTADQQTTWDGFAEYERDRKSRRNRPARVGTIFHLAQTQGGKAFYAATKRFGKRQTTDTAWAASPGNQTVLDVAATLPGGDIRDLIIGAHYSHYMRYCRRRSYQCAAILDIISDHINRTLNIAYMGRWRIAESLAQGGRHLDHETIGEYIDLLVADGYLVKSDGRGITPDGRRGSIYALTLPNGLSWDDLLSWRNREMQHDDPDHHRRYRGTDAPMETVVGGPSLQGRGHPDGNGGQAGGLPPQGYGHPEPATVRSSKREEGERGVPLAGDQRPDTQNPDTDAAFSATPVDDAPAWKSKKEQLDALRASEQAARLARVHAMAAETNRLPLELIGYIVLHAERMTHPNFRGVDQLRDAIDEAAGRGCDDARIHSTLKRAFDGASSAYLGETPEGGRLWGVKDLDPGKISPGDFMRMVRNRFVLMLAEDPTSPVPMASAAKIRRDLDKAMRLLRFRRETARPTPPHRPAQAPPAHQPAPYQHQQSDPSNAYRRARDGE